MSCHAPDDVATADAATSTRVALLGAPNAGKSSLFNRLTGLRAKTGNYPGVTVSRSFGDVRAGETNLVLEDLPGTYSLEAVSPDEQVVVDALAGRLDGVPAPHALIVVADATTLRRSLPFVARAIALGKPTMLALTMIDELHARGGHLDVAALERALGVPVRAVMAATGAGVDDIRALLADVPAWTRPVVSPPTQDAQLAPWSRSVLAAAEYTPAGQDTRSRRIDAVLLHPVAGLAVFFATMFLFFQAIFTVAAPLQDLVEQGFAWLGAQAQHIPNDTLASLVGNGIIGGVGATLVFVPQIMLLFLVLSLLENVGYLSRAAFLMDRIMAATGLEGRAFVAMLSSFACAVPGIMATRTIPSSRNRIATIITAPLMTCSARLPVYVLLTSLLVEPGQRYGPFNAQGLVLFGLYVLGGLSALVAVAVFKATALRDASLPFYMEMPPYRFPSIRNVVTTMWHSVRMFLRKAGGIILTTTVALWVLLNFPARGAETAGMGDTEKAAYVIDHSYAASIGRFIEPIFAPLGFDWHICVGLLGATSAREVFVATLGQVASATDPEDPRAALMKMTFSDGPHAGQLVFTTATVVALLVFFVYALQCVSTIAIMRRETNTWRWPAIAWAYMFVLAWGMAFLARHIVLALT